jgi:8-oxo-dGTP pyrophosphatase MutT (NUDIX family)
MPGGGIKRHESPVEAAYRELFEETGVRVDQLTWFGQYTQEIEYKHDTVECYYGSVATREVYPDNFEIEAVAWFSRLDIPTDCSPSVHKIFTLYDSQK